MIEKSFIKKLIAENVAEGDLDLVTDFICYYFNFEIPGSQSGYGLDASDLDYSAVACALRKIILEKTVK